MSSTLATIIAGLSLEFQTSDEELSRYIEERSTHMATVRMQDRAAALEVETQNITLFALGRAIDLADQKDAELRQTVKTLLVVAVHLLV